MQKTTINPRDLVIKTPSYNVYVQSVSYEPPRYDWIVENHCHNSFEIHFITKGKGTLIVDGKKSDIQKGDFYITGPGIFHSQISDNLTPMEEYCVNISIKKVKEKSKSDIDVLLKAISDNPFYIDKDDFDALGLCSKIIKDVQKFSLAFDEYIKSLVLALIILVGRKIIGENIKTSIKFTRPNLTRALDVCLRDFKDDISADIVAKKLFITKRHLSRIMKDIYKMTFPQKIASMRVSYAKGLIETTNLSMEQISEKSGFSSAQSFCKTFKKHIGITPRQYKKSIYKSES